MPSPRDRILERIQKALAAPSPEPHFLHEPVSEDPLFPLPAASIEALESRFCEEFAAVSGEIVRAESVEEARRWLADWALPIGDGGILAAEAARLQPLLAGLPRLTWGTKDGPGSRDWRDFAAGITEAESLVAESGTIVVSAASAGRAPSVLPPLHLVVASADQIVPDLETSIARLRSRHGSLPSSATWITGPSRTADIEKILVLGAHGPKRLVLLLLPAGSLGG